jgi:hypothetical protein
LLSKRTKGQKVKGGISRRGKKLKAKDKRQKYVENQEDKGDPDKGSTRNTLPYA